MNHKRRKPRYQRAGCKLCKPWKDRGARTEHPDGESYSAHVRRKTVGDGYGLDV